MQETGKRLSKEFYHEWQYLQEFKANKELRYKIAILETRIEEKNIIIKKFELANKEVHLNKLKQDAKKAADNVNSSKELYEKFAEKFKQEYDLDITNCAIDEDTYEILSESENQED